MRKTIRHRGKSLVLAIQYSAEELQDNTPCTIWYETLDGCLITEQIHAPTVESAFLSGVWYKDVCNILLPFTDKAKRGDYVTFAYHGKVVEKNPRLLFGIAGD